MKACRAFVYADKKVADVSITTAMDIIRDLFDNVLAADSVLGARTVTMVSPR